MIFKTSGYSQGDHKLHFGNVLLEQGDGATALFFVIHPNSWGPYQRAFLTPSFAKFAEDTLAKGMSKKVSNVGAAIGSVIPGAHTVVGGIIGKLIGNAATTATEDYQGDYLCYVGDREAGFL